MCGRQRRDVIFSILITQRAKGNASHNRGFRKQHKTDNVDISDIFDNFVFHFGRDYQLCMEHTSFLICNY